MRRRYQPRPFKIPGCPGVTITFLPEIQNDPGRLAAFTRELQPDKFERHLKAAGADEKFINDYRANVAAEGGHYAR